MRSFVLRAVSAALTLVLIQAAIETVLLAWLYRNLLLAPYRFFTSQIYDGFTKLYFLLGERWSLPSLAGEFLAHGFAPKLAIGPQLVAAGISVALPLAFFLAVVVWVAQRWRLSPDDRAGGSGAPEITTLWGLAFLQAFVHIGLWLTRVKIPVDPTVVKVASNLARDAIYDGVCIALGVCLVAAVAAQLLLRRQGRYLAVGSMVAAAVLGLWMALAQSSGMALAGEFDAGLRQVSLGAEAAAAAPARDYNVILISIDSLRADHLGVYGYAKDTSPAIDGFAARGLAFNDCSSTTSWTLPAHMSMLTGRSLLGHGVISDDRRLSADVPTLAQSFADAGYRTGAIVSAPYVNSRYGFAKGFDDYDDHSVHFETNEDSYKSVTAPIVQDAAAGWLERNANGRFFLFLHYWDVHYDYAPGPPYDRMFDPDYAGSLSGEDFYFNPKINKDISARDLEHLLALYDGEIRLVDDYIGRLRDHVEELGIADRTVFVITADHGDEFFEHGRKGHHRTLYEEVLRVPLVISVPGLSRPGRKVDGEVSIIDIAPTLLGLAGIPKPRGLEGVDLSSLFSGGNTPPSRAVYSELYRGGSMNIQISERVNSKKLIHHFKRRQAEAYDLSADPSEVDALSPTTPALASLMPGMRKWLNRRWRVFDDRIRREGIDEVVMDASTLDTLRALGYVE